MRTYTLCSLSALQQKLTGMRNFDIIKHFSKDEDLFPDNLFYISTPVIFIRDNSALLNNLNQTMGVSQEASHGLNRYQ